MLVYQRVLQFWASSVPMLCFGAALKRQRVEWTKTKVEEAAHARFGAQPDGSKDFHQSMMIQHDY